MNIGQQMHRRWPLVLMVVIALACVAGAVLVPLGTWSDFFAHPAQQNQELVEQGARLWRVMLGALAVMLVIAAVVWGRVGELEAIEETRALSRKRLGGLVLIVIAGLALRLTRINESLWYDEIASWMTYSAGADSIGAVVGNFFDPINHPLHTLLNHLSVKWFSDALGVEIAFRLPALIFSLLSILAMFGLVRAASDERNGFIAAALTAIVPVSILEGVEARGYSMVIFFCAMSTWLLIVARTRPSSALWLAYALCASLGVWAHFVAAFAPLGHGVWILWRAMRFGEWRLFAQGAAALALAGVIALTLYSPMIPGLLAAKGMFAATSINQPTIISAEGLHALLQLGGAWYWWAALPGLALAALGLLTIASRRDEWATFAFELTLLGLPLMLIVVALSGTWMYARFTFFALPGGLLLMTLGLRALRHWRPMMEWIALSGVAIAAGADLFMRPPKQPLRDAAQLVISSAAPNEHVLVIGLAHPVSRLYLPEQPTAYSFMHGQDLARKLASHRPSWVIVEYPNRVSKDNFELLKRAGFVEVQHFDGWADWVQGDVRVYRRTSPQP